MLESEGEEEAEGLIDMRVTVSCVRVAPAGSGALAAAAASQELDRAMSVALEQVGWGPFQQRTLLPITGLTLMADAMVTTRNHTTRNTTRRRSGAA